MITFKQKEYVRQEAYQQLKEDQKILPDPELVSRYGECKLVLEEHKSFIKQRAESSYKREIKSLVKDIKNYYLYNDGPAGGETHYLSEFSRIGRFIVMSKKISYSDRLNYRIYPPEVINGVYQMKVVLISCASHLIPGIGTYSLT